MLCGSCIMKMAQAKDVEEEKLEKIGEAVKECEKITNPDSQVYF